MFSKHWKYLSLLAIFLLILSFSIGCVTKDIDAENESLQAQITNLQTTVAKQAEEIANLPKYAVVTELAQSYIKVSIIGEGNYPVFVHLYGAGLITEKVITNKLNYHIIAEYEYSNVLTVVVEPIESWLARDTLELGLTSLYESGGIVYYASAVVGRKG